MSLESPIRKTDNWFIGADKTFRYSIKDSAGAAQDITGWTFEWVLRAGPWGNTSLISKTVGSGIAVVGAAADGVIDVTIADTDTDGMDEGDYYYTLWRTNDGNETELAYGTATLRRPAKRA